MLTDEQKREFYEIGFIKLENAMPEDVLLPAKKAINHLLGQIVEGVVPVPEKGRARPWKELSQQSVITDLLNNSPVYQLCESLMGTGNVQCAQEAQIALRYPSMEEALDGRDPLKGHLDLGNVGGPKGGYRRFFTMHAVIYLEDVHGPFSGNYTIWPKSHRFYQDYFQKHGHEVLYDGQPKQPQPTDPVMVTGNAGDVVLAHHQMVHGPAPNTSPHVRYAVIFRVQHVDVDKNGRECYLDIWREFPGVHEVVAEAKLVS